jgi:hypothetical protein
MNELDHFKDFVLCSDYVAADVDHLHVKRIHLVVFSYIVIEDKTNKLQQPLLCTVEQEFPSMNLVANYSQNSLNHCPP